MATKRKTFDDAAPAAPTARTEEQREAYARTGAPIGDRLCQANGCPCVGSIGTQSELSCSWHWGSHPRNWPEITRRLRVRIGLVRAWEAALNRYFWEPGDGEKIRRLLGEQFSEHVPHAEESPGQFSSRIGALLRSEILGSLPAITAPIPKPAAGPVKAAAVMPYSDLED